MSPVRPLLLFALLLAGACASDPVEPLGAADLEGARLAVAEGQWEEAEDLLTDMEREHFDRVSQGEFSLLAGDIYYNLDDYKRSIRNYEDFLRFEGAAADSRRAEERLLEMGLYYLEGGGAALGVFTHRGRGEVTLQNLAGWAPASPAAAEALARLGEYHFQEREFEEAILDYRQILRFHRHTEWGDLATFRIGLAGYYQIKNPQVDGNLMRSSLSQLTRYLADYPSGLYRREAEDTVAKLEELLAAKELSIGEFYTAIDNVRGARYHYRLAAAIEGTASGQEARKRLEDLPPDPPLSTPPADDE